MEKAICFVEPPRLSYGKIRNYGYVLIVQGAVLAWDMQEVGRDLSEMMIEEPTPDDFTGLLVWEGECLNENSRHHGGDWEPDLKGSWRKPMYSELINLRNGEYKNAV
jgi:hypothetical protein